MTANSFCEPCMTENKEVQAIAKCSECEEYLCLMCKKTHKKMKMLKDHHIQDISYNPTHAQSTQLKQAQVVTMPNAPPKPDLKLKRRFKVRDCVYGIASSFDDNLLLCICWKKILMKTDLSGNILGELLFDTEPFDVASIPTKCLSVVSLPDKQAIQYVNEKHLVPDTIVPLPGKGKGIAASYKMIVVGGFKSFYWFNVGDTGVYQTLVECEATTPIESINLCSDGTILYTDVRTAFRVTIDGQQLWKYASQEIKLPRGIAEDGNGFVYVVSNCSNYVEIIDKDGKFYHRIATDNERMENPWAMCFSKDCNQLMVANNRFRSYIVVFNCI